MKNINTEITGQGWISLIGKVQAIVNKIPFAEIISINREHGMLRIKFTEVLDKSEQYILDSISYKIERDSVHVCEECGAYAMRRKNLPVTMALCTTCYTIQYNEMMSSVSPEVTNQEPQTS